MSTRKDSLPIRKILGVVLATLGLLLPVLLDFNGLDRIGQLSLGIFFMAACLWIFEPIPIWSTSLLVIFSQVILLSKEGPHFQLSQPETVQMQLVEDARAETGEVFSVPSSALGENGQLALLDEASGTLRHVTVKILQHEDESALVSAGDLQQGELAVVDRDHWKMSYEPLSYQQFYNTMANRIIILFLGGFFLAAGAVKYGLDKNLTALMLRLFGTRSSNVVLGLLVATGVLSAFMSNTATTAMMITVVLPILTQLDADDRLRIAVALAIPCGANIGGIATPIGTPPNAVVLSALAKNGYNISFAEWMVIALPLVIIMMFLTWRILLLMFPAKTDRLTLQLSGGWSRAPKAILCYAIFGITVLLWVTDKLHGVSSYAVAFVPIALMPMFGIIEKADLKRFAWDVLWLMSGGIALGISMQLGPAEWLISLVDWSAFSSFGIILVLGLVAYLVANVISHTVAATILMPIAISIGTSGAVVGDFNLTLACVTVGIMVSFSMLLPISTPPNAIAMSTGMLETRHLMRVGIVVGVLGYILSALFGYFVWGALLPLPA